MLQEGVQFMNIALNYTHGENSLTFSPLLLFPTAKPSNWIQFHTQLNTCYLMRTPWLN